MGDPIPPARYARLSEQNAQECHSAEWRGAPSASTVAASEKEQETSAECEGRA